MDKNKFVVFDNTPHKQYMGLKEKVRDVQITFFREEIEEQGYKLSEPVSLIQFPFDNRLNPIYNMFFWNVIPDLKENVDIYIFHLYNLFGIIFGLPMLLMVYLSLSMNMVF